MTVEIMECASKALVAKTLRFDVTWPSSEVE